MEIFMIFSNINDLVLLLQLFSFKTILKWPDINVAWWERLNQSLSRKHYKLTGKTMNWGLTRVLCVAVHHHHEEVLLLLQRSDSRVVLVMKKQRFHWSPVHRNTGGGGLKAESSFGKVPDDFFFFPTVCCMISLQSGCSNLKQSCP